MKTKIGIIGGGNMGEAILKGIGKKYSVSICESRAARKRYLKKKYRVKSVDLETLALHSKVIILAVKPQNMEAVLKSFRPHVKTGHVIVSIAAGITISYIERKLRKSIRVIRTMPNMPAQIGEGITAVSKGKWATKNDVALTRRIFNQIGKTVVVQEHLIDAVTAVSGSGPAYVYLFVETFKKSAKALGLSDKLSQNLVMQTITGSLKLLESQDESAESLRTKVTSKGGTTHAALMVFFKYKFPVQFKQALKAAQRRAKVLAKR